MEVLLLFLFSGTHFPVPLLFRIAIGVYDSSSNSKTPMKKAIEYHFWGFFFGIYLRVAVYKYP